MAGAGIHPYHQQWVPPQPQPPDRPPSISMESHGRPAGDEVRTIFITGLPADVKERELHNLLRWLPGFEASQINFKGEQPMGFALFATGQHALMAKNSLQNLVFDADSNSTLHTEMAKKNLFIKRGVVTEANSVDQSKRLRTGSDYAHHTGYAPPTFHRPPPPPVWGTPGYMAPPAPYEPYGCYPPIPQAAMPPAAPVPVPITYAPVQNTKDNPPCNTLFIGNLGENVNEEEVHRVFSVQPGFKQMKILHQERNTVCFIEFEDVNSAANVHQNLQGTVLSSSSRGGMRIQFSKNQFGRRKDSVHGAAAESNGAPLQQ